MKRGLFFIFLFIVVIALYYFERESMFNADINFNESGESITRTISIVVMLFISMLAVIIAREPLLQNNLSKRYSYLSLVIIILSIAFSLFYPLGSRNIYGTLFLPLMLFYFMRVTPHHFKSEDIIIWTMTALFLSLAFYYFSNHSSVFDTAHITQDSYLLLYLFPFLLCHKKRILRILSIILTLFIVMYSLKRGGFMALLMGIGVYLLVYQIGINNKKIKAWQTIVIVIFGFSIFFLVNYLNENVFGSGLSDRFMEDNTGGSGRTELYSYYWNMFLNSSIFQFFFGRGWMGSMRESGLGLTCHNDFLESIIDFGVLGLIFYIGLYVGLIKYCRKLIRNRNIYAPAMAASITIFLCNSLVSHILIYPRYLVCFSLFWGFMVSLEKTNSNISYNEKDNARLRHEARSY